MALKKDTKPNQTLVAGAVSYPSAKVQSVYSTAAADWSVDQICI